MTAAPDGRRWRHPEIADWEQLGTYRRINGHEIFTVDLGPTGADRAEPLLIIHGYPTSSFDFADIAPRLAEDRRVVLADMLGFGLSDKPDVRYTIDTQADIVAAFTAELGLHTMALLTHDLGDTVGGELLARQLEGHWPVEITRRVLTNGSVYIEMAHLSAGQELLLSLPDARIPDESVPDEAALAAGLAGTLSPTSAMAAERLGPHAELISHRGGAAMLARTIRYIEERRKNQPRYTGAIEGHPSPLGVVWGADDPIAVSAMAPRLVGASSGASLHWLPGVGHYPMLEAPEAFLSAVQETLGGAAARGA